MTNEMKASVEKYLKAHEEISFKYDAAGRKMWYRSTFIKLSDGTSFWNESPDHKITKALAQCFLREYDLTIDEFVAAENEYFKAKANETTETKAEVAEVKNDVEEVKAETTETKAEVAEVENNIEEEEDLPKFEVGKTYCILCENNKPYTIKIEARTAKMLTGTTIEGTRKYHIWDTIRGEHVNVDLTDEFGNHEPIWAMYEYKPEVKADELSEELIGEYIISEEAQTIATDAESELANKAETKEEVATETTEVKADRITELKAKSKGLWEKFRASLQGYYVNFNGNFFSTDDALDFTTFLNDKYDGLYRKDENGEYVKIESEEFDKINRIEIELDAINGAINAEIARNAVKFVAGKWYTDSEGCKYLILKRTAKTVTVYNQDQDDWNALKSYDANDEIDGEFDCIFRKKIQFDERGEYVDWEDEEGELVQVFAKNETEPPTDDDDDNEETDNGEENTNTEVDNTNTTTALVPAEFYAKHEIKLNIDDFDTKLAELKADCNQKAAELDTARAALEQATIAYDDAEQKWADAANAVNNLCRDKARQLTTELNTITSNTHINIQFRSGNYKPLADWQLWIDFGQDTFKVCADKKAGLITNVIADYDTPAQVTAVINQLKAAIARGDNQFNFPTVDELNNPIENEPKEPDNSTPDKLRDSLARGMEACLFKMQEHLHNHDLKAAMNEMGCYNLCAAALHDSCTASFDTDDTPTENNSPNNTIDKLNRVAPDGWLISFDSDKKVFHVKFNDKVVTTLDSLVLQKFLTPAQFFDQFKPLVDDNFSPKQQFINDRIREIQALQEMRSDAPPDSLAKINELIEQNKRDLLQAEFNEKET